ncbi:MAG: hypothetical protein ACI9SJ_002454 [Flavobacteriaceae bacterium]|uniref:hypothetical protein n=1 Tax=Candidatus Marifrigoribacter sp. Uisw_064 TaxID=3230970 RepID=UPI003AE27331
MKNLLIILLFPSFLLSQELTLVSETSLLADSFIGIDNYQNLYFVKDNVINKEGKEGDFIYNDLQLGEIASIDIINPLKIIVFYEDTNTVVMLDNQLSEIERIQFNMLPEFIHAGSVTNAGNNQLWVFNINTQELILYNYRNNSKTANTLPFEGEIISQVSSFNFCYLLTEKSLQKFNNYGSLIYKTDANNFNQITQSDKTLIAIKGNELYYLDENNLLPIKIDTSEITVKDLQLSQDFLYIYNGEKLLNYTLTHPKE